jgi:uncharacterized phage protein gp47/JayE
MPSNSSGLAPAITATGITAGNFAQWQAYFIAQYEAIFGADSFLGNDSQDGQFIGVISQALADVCASAIAVYNSFSPATAQGAGLASNVKINGLKKLIATFSTVPLTIVGQANSTITNGQAIDQNKVIWNLPPSVTIPGSGTINVIATCATQGAVTAAPGTINKIQTPTSGWQSVTNASAATVGVPIETDAALRVRQAASVSLPSVTIFEGIVASLEQVAGVTRVKGYENNTGSADGNGIPRNTLYFIVEGGAQADIFNAIFEKITPGISTMGSISTTITDSNGSTRLLKYDLPVDATMSVAITVKALAGWQVSTEQLIAAALVNYFQSLPGGSNISFLGLPAIALLPGTPFFGTFAITAMTIKKNSGSAVSSDIQLAFNEMAVSSVGNVAFTVT